jgi:hypothetical protein
MIDFDTDLKYMGMEVPHHTRDSITNYLISGWAPGGFVEAMIAKDYERAKPCDHLLDRLFYSVLGRVI